MLFLEAVGGVGLRGWSPVLVGPRQGVQRQGEGGLVDHVNDSIRK